MPIQEKTTVFVFNACHADKAAAASANALHSLEVEYPMTLNDLSLLCEYGQGRSAEYGWVPVGSHQSCVCPRCRGVCAGLIDHSSELY